MLLATRCICLTGLTGSQSSCLLQDATWVAATNSTCCTNADEVVLLLKSSDRVADDICHAFDACPARPAEPVQHVLVLKKQYDLRPEREFRCFVRGHQLIGKATCWRVCAIACRAPMMQQLT